MMPPFPMELTLWGSALYTELATGLWRALAAPWLQPGWPAVAGAPAHRRADGPRPVGQPAGVACPADEGRRCAGPTLVPDTAPAAQTAPGRVIQVPRGRWQHRRERAGATPVER